jgi:hypothetical protein
MMSSDYENLLEVFDREFGSFVILERWYDRWTDCGRFCAAIFAVIIIVGSISIWYENYQDRKNNIVKWKSGSNDRHWTYRKTLSCV